MSNINLVMDTKEFRLEWEHLRRGEFMTYYRGDLQYDRQQVRSLGSHTLDLVAGIAWDLHVVGKAVLVQVKHGPNDYEYKIGKVR